MLREAAYYSRMASGLGQLLRAPHADDPESVISSQLHNREAAFLQTVRQVIFENPLHPYCAMFRLAGCGYEDFAAKVRQDGLETALEAIRAQGVRLSHDEFKGKTAIVRSGRHIPSDERSFLNPLATGRMESTSSGSRSAGTVTRQNVRNQVYRECYFALAAKEFSLRERKRIVLMPTLPSTAGLLSCAHLSRHGASAERWFTTGGTARTAGHYQIMTRLLVLEARLMRADVPYPIQLPANDFSPVAKWIARRRTEGASFVVSSMVSAAVRVAAAAVEKGLDIRGTLFQVGGEALSDAKRAVLEEAGAEVAPFYFINELGNIGHSCRQMRTGNSVHLFSDAIAAINHRRRAPLSETDVDSLLFTTLLPSAPRLLINVEMDDSGIVEPAGCDCTYSRIGLTRSVRQIFSFGKLTGLGMTLVGSELTRVLEEALPARCGGRPGDYQLIEREGAAQTQLVLRVSPRARPPSVEQVRECFLGEIRRYYGGTLASRVWRHAEAVEVVVAEPFATATGKVLSLHLLGTGGNHHAS